MWEEVTRLQKSLVQHSLTYITISSSPYKEMLENSVVALQHPRNRDFVAGFAMSTSTIISKAASASARGTVPTALCSTEVAAHVLSTTYIPYLRLYCIPSMPFLGRASETSSEDLSVFQCADVLCALCFGHSENGHRRFQLLLKCAFPT